jgi:hypothetical protein
MIHEQMTVGVVVERRVSSSTWGEEVTWRPVAVLPGAPDVAPWTRLGGGGAVTRYFAGAACIDLYSTDTASYRDNLATGAAKLWVVLRPNGPEPPAELALVTADPSEGEAATGGGNVVVEPVDMPPELVAVLAGFVEAHHVERPFIKRQRKPGPKGDSGPRGPRVVDRNDEGAQ